MFSPKLLWALAIAAAASTAIPTSGRASTWNGSTATLNVGACCGSGPFGTVAGSGFGTNTVTLTVTLNSGFQFISGGQDAVFAFLLDESDVTLTATSTGGGTGSGTGWTSVSGSVHMDGGGTFGQGTEHSGNGGSNPLGNVLTIVLNDATDFINASDFITNSSGFLFASDISTNCVTTPSVSCDGSTGIVENGPVAATPLPAAAVLFGSVLFGGLGVSTWRRRRSSRSTTSVLA
jgi:hypothetical protein